MPTISAFYGILIQIFWREQGRHIFMRCMPSTRH
jgi:hypothetical protein